MNNAKWFIIGGVLALALIIGFTVYSPKSSENEFPSPTPAAREPVSPDELMDFIDHTKRAVDASHWDEANNAVGTLRERWATFRPTMRAGGSGDTTWPESDVTQFDRTLGKVEASISRQERDKATEHVDELGEIVRKNVQSKEFPLTRQNE